MDLQMRAAAQNSAIQWANDLMAQGVSAAMLEDAINALLVKLKEQILLDTMFEYQQKHKQAAESSAEGDNDGSLQDESE